jgi:hypothetical protein
MMPFGGAPVNPFGGAPAVSPFADGAVNPVTIDFIEPPPAGPAFRAPANLIQKKEVSTVPTTVQVVEPYRVVHEGNPYVGGDVLEIPADKADEWTKSGWVTPVAKKGQK